MVVLQGDLHRWREAVLPEVYARRLECSISPLLRRGDEDLGPRLELALVARHVGDDRGSRRKDDLLFAILVLDRQHVAIDAADDLLDICVGHGALGTQVPRTMPLAGSAHRFGKDM